MKISSGSTRRHGKNQTDGGDNGARDNPISSTKSTSTPFPLPSERDRNATIGCLAAVLNIMFAHQFRFQHDTKRASLKKEKSKRSGARTRTSSKRNNRDSTSKSDDASNTNRTTISAAADSSKNSGGIVDDIGGMEDGDEDASSVSIRRTREFQRELLTMAAELLFPDPNTHAVEYMPTLDIIYFDGASDDGKSTDNNNHKKNSETKTIVGDEQAAEATAERMLLDPFLSSFSSEEAGFQCISLLLFRFLLLSNNGDNTNDKNCKNNDSDDKKSISTSKNDRNSPNQLQNTATIVGYDARVRYAIKYLSVSILAHWDLRRNGTFVSRESAAEHATRIFEALEDELAQRLSAIYKRIQEDDQIKKKKKAAASTTDTFSHSSDSSRPFSLKKHPSKSWSLVHNVSRGLKIGGAGLAAGVIIAATGGFAVPAIVGGIAAVTGVTAGFATVATISILVMPAVVTVFGVGSGILVAKKMTKRTMGLTEFEIIYHETKKEEKTRETSNRQQQQQSKLSRTICVNGWLNDEHDFDRPFGVTPKTLRGKHELLCRFCSVFVPEVIPKCGDILQEWKGKENELWEMLRTAYGKDPDTLLPLGSGPVLSTKENESLDSMIQNMGMHVPPVFEEQHEKDQNDNDGDNNLFTLLPPVNLLADVLTNISSSTNSNASMMKKEKRSNVDDKIYRSFMVWDFQSLYGGTELYTISWEKDLLIQLRGSARDVQMDLAKTATEHALKKTILASLMAAVALPATLLGLTNIIDEKWTLAAERADEAGILLAESLLRSDAGHRPVTLVGISFGARMIASCLRELACHQKIWEQQQRHRDNNWKNSPSMKMSSLRQAGDLIRKSVISSATKRGPAENDTYLREPASIVENVILMGCPASIKNSTWKSIRNIVAGRLVNCFCTTDLMLALMYRMKNIKEILNPPAGIVEAKVQGVTNYDVSSLVSNHGEYGVVVKEILALAGFNQPEKRKN